MQAKPRAFHLARLVSIAGHPAVVMSLAAWIAAPRESASAALVASVACAGAVLADSARKVRRGEWTHVDASVPVERAQLNTRGGLGLLAAAGFLALVGVHAGIPLVVGLIVLAGLLFRHVAKLSLHVAFAVFAAGMAWSNVAAAVGFLALAGAVGWSRLVLGRHVRRDVALGSLTGLTAGLAFQILIRPLAG